MGAIYCFAIGELHARALLHMVLTVAPGGPGFATVGAGVWSETKVEAQVVLHVAELRHTSLTDLAFVHFVNRSCLAIDERHPGVVLGKLLLRVILCDLICRLCGWDGVANGLKWLER